MLVEAALLSHPERKRAPFPVELLDELRALAEESDISLGKNFFGFQDPEDPNGTWYAFNDIKKADNKRWFSISIGTGKRSESSFIRTNMPSWNKVLIRDQWKITYMPHPDIKGPTERNNQAALEKSVEMVRKTIDLLRVYTPYDES